MSRMLRSDGGRPGAGEEIRDAATAPGDLLRLDQVEGEETVWLWPERLPLGYVTAVAGEAGSGKSLLAAEIAARASNGAAWPDRPDKRTACPVLIAHSDPHLDGVVKRRLLAAGADPRRVALIHRDGNPADGMTPADLLIARLEAALDQIADCALVVVDRLLGWLRKASLRPDEQADVFDKLTALAARRQIALVVVWRLEKAARGGQVRALDALLAAAPVVWLLARDPCRANNHLMASAQNQLGRPAGNLAFHVDDDRLVWQTAARQMAADDVAAACARSVDRSERRQAGEWLLHLLSEGPIEAQRLWEEARQCHLSERTVRRAAAELDLHPIKAGGRGPWLWGFRAERGLLGAAEESPGASVAVLETVGSLTDSAAICDAAEVPAAAVVPAPAVVAVELRRDAAPSVAALETAGSLADSAAICDAAVAAAPAVVPAAAVVAMELRRDAAPSVPVFAGSGTGVETDASVAALDTAGSLAESEPARREEAKAEKRRRRKLRRERQALESFMSTLRGD